MWLAEPAIERRIDAFAKEHSQIVPPIIQQVRLPPGVYLIHLNSEISSDTRVGWGMWQTALQHVTVPVAWQARTLMYFFLRRPLHSPQVHPISVFQTPIFQQ